jgi:hypothetical protein
MIICRYLCDAWGPVKRKINAEYGKDVTPQFRACQSFGSLGIAVICQTQPIKMTWSPLRLFFRTFGDLRGRFKRENEMEVNLFSRHDHFMNQALSYGLALLKRESFEIVT